MQPQIIHEIMGGRPSLYARVLNRIVWPLFWFTIGFSAAVAILLYVR